MENEFAEVMAKNTDAELVKIVAVDRDGYQPLAVEAAEAEIQKRGLDNTKIEELKAEHATQVQEEKQEVEREVTKSSRFIHTVVDTFFYFVLTYLVYSAVSVFISDSKRGLGVGIAFISFFAYYVILEYFFQKTVGKFMTKTKVVSLDGQRPTLGAIVVRTACRLIPFDRASYMFTKNGFHDYLSYTAVVNDGFEDNIADL